MLKLNDKIYEIEEMQNIALEKKDNCEFLVGKLNNEEVYAEVYIDSHYDEERNILEYYVHYVAVDTLSPSPVMAFDDEHVIEFQTGDGELDSLLGDLREEKDLSMRELLEELKVKNLEYFSFNGDYYFNFDGEDAKEKAEKAFFEIGKTRPNKTYLSAIITDNPDQSLESFLYELDEMPESIINSVCLETFDEMNYMEAEGAIETIKNYLTENIEVCSH